MTDSAPWNVPHMTSGSSKPNIDPEKVVLYNMRFCPFAERTVLVLLAKGIPFQVVNISIQDKPEWFKEETTGTVSVVLYKGNIIPDSVINSDYLDEAFPENRLHPTDPAQKAKDRLVLEKFGRIITPYYAAFRALVDKKEDKFKDPFETFCGMLQDLDKELTKRGNLFFGGDKPAMLDYMIWPVFERYPVLKLLKPDLEFPNTPKLTAWVQAMWKTDAVSRYGLKTEIHRKLYMDMKPNGDLNYDMLLNQ